MIDERIKESLALTLGKKGEEGDDRCKYSGCKAARIPGTEV